MKFDKSKVYTALNADELEIGSKCIFADNLTDLKKYVEHNYNIYTLFKIMGEDWFDRFAVTSFPDTYSLAYFVDPPPKTKYRPFISYEKLIVAIKRHGAGIRKKEDKNDSIDIYAMTVGGAIMTCEGEAFGFYPPFVLLENYVFRADGSPCGELVEE